jgi:hypothetical protein
MKKFIIFGVVLALLVPTLAMAATEFSLGGFIKMDMMWDSDSGVGKNMNVAPSRNNDPSYKHGRLKFTAQGSRFNFTIKGPDLWGAKTSGFIEMDFDCAEAPIANSSFTSSNSYTPRLRHAMFRFNWPTSELLFGQYWSMFCEYYAESAEDGPLQMTGTPTARNAQVRFTQKFSDFTLAASISDPNQARLTTSNTSPYTNNALFGPATVGSAFPYVNNGESAETPQIQGKVSYAHDFWGKAAYYGKPTPFTIQFVGGWQRNVQRPTVGIANNTWTGVNPVALGETGVYGQGSNVFKAQYVNPWLAMGSLFIPVIPTQSANLAGTASILTQWWIGQGVEAFGFSGVAGNKYFFNGLTDPVTGNVVLNAVTPSLLNKFGGFVQGQYYFNNQWFINGLYAFSKAYGVNRSIYYTGGGNYAGPNAATFSDQSFASGNEAQTIQQFNATLWYRPIQAIKFGLQYSYMAAHYFQMNTTPVASNINSTNFGDNHRVEFVGFFYF